MSSGRLAKIAAAAITAAALLLAAGCSGGSGAGEVETGKVVKIRGFGWNSEEMEEAYIKAFEQKYPNIDIEYQFVDIGQADAMLNAQLAAGEGPDFFMLGAGYRSLASAGYLEPVDGKPFLDKYTDTGLQAFTYNGHVYAAPSLSWFGGLFYNKKLFSEHGVEVPKTYDEWLEASEKFKQADVRPIIMGGNSWESFLHLSVGVVLNDYYSKEGARAFDTDYAEGKTKLADDWKGPLGKWEELVKRGYIDKDLLGMSYDQAEEEFAKGNAAVFAGGGNWSLSEIKAKNPDLDFGMFAYPGIDGGPGWLIGGPGSGYGLNAKSEHKEEVLKLFEFMAEPDTQKAIYAKLGGSSFVKGVSLPLDPAFEPARAAMEAGNVYCPWYYWFDSEPIITEYGKALQDYLAGGKTIEEVLKQTDKKADELRSVRAS